MEVRLEGIDDLQFAKDSGLIPTIIQDARSRDVLMLAYMNRESLQKSLETGECWFYSRSRQELWHKGGTSGNTQKIQAVFYDCDGDTLLIEVIPKGPACHTGAQNCFYRTIVEDEARPGQLGQVVSRLYEVILDRKANPIEGSYTNYLLIKGIDKILKKVGEETAEVIIGAKNGSQKELVYEIADLSYHLLVLLVEMECTPQDIVEELARRLVK